MALLPHRRGATPVRDFLISSTLPSDDRDEFLAAMKDAQVNGVRVARHLRGDIYELRATGSHGSYGCCSPPKEPAARWCLHVGVQQEDPEDAASGDRPRRTPPCRLAPTGPWGPINHIWLMCAAWPRTTWTSSSTNSQQRTPRSP